MPENVFIRDDVWQRNMRDKILKPLFYQKRYGEKFVFLDRGAGAMVLQRSYGIDTIVQTGVSAVCFEEKIVRWPADRGRPYEAFALEEWSCTVEGRIKTGWMDYSNADHLLYCFSSPKETALDCYMIDMPALQEWFWPLCSTFPKSISDQINKTQVRIVEIAKVVAAVPTERFDLYFDRGVAAA